jgi:Fe-Mn family superoxide dismutase
MFSRSTPGFRSLSQRIRAKHTLPDLPYDYNALEPFISAGILFLKQPLEIMQIHHAKHHAAYVANLFVHSFSLIENRNLAEEKIHAAKTDLPATIHLQQMLKFNGGGHINHSIFWTNLAPPTGINQIA